MTLTVVTPADSYTYTHVTIDVPLQLTPGPPAESHLRSTWFHAGTSPIDIVTLGSARPSVSQDTIEEPPWRGYLRRRLHDLLSASDSPGYPSPETLNGAWNVATGLLRAESPTPSIVPGEDAAVELVWQRGDWHIELDIGPQQTYVWARHRDTGETVSGDLDDLDDVFRDLIAEISA